MGSVATVSGIPCGRWLLRRDEIQPRITRVNGPLFHPILGLVHAVGGDVLQDFAFETTGMDLLVDLTVALGRHCNHMKEIKRHGSLAYVHGFEIEINNQSDATRGGRRRFGVDGTTTAARRQDWTAIGGCRRRSAMVTGVVMVNGGRGR